MNAWTLSEAAATPSTAATSTFRTRSEKSVAHSSISTPKKPTMTMTKAPGGPNPPGSSSDPRAPLLSRNAPSPSTPNRMVAAARIKRSFAAKTQPAPTGSVRWNSYVRASRSPANAIAPLPNRQKAGRPAANR